jgi:hypothetical protein
VTNGTAAASGRREPVRARAGKIGVWGEGIGKILDENAELDYFHGED